MNGQLGAMTPLYDPVGYRLEPSYQLSVGNDQVNLNDWIGQGISLTYLHNLECVHCAKEIRKHYPGGYCYDCFTTLARCDLCVMSPERCHFHLGTCREPEWGEDFCMQPHSVYLANTSGPKIGITRVGRERRRWLDQGATQAIRIATVPTRRAAGVVEAHFKRTLNDRTDWRKMVSGTGISVDLLELAGQLQRDLPLLADIEANILPATEIAGLDWSIDSQVTEICYPVNQYSPAKRLVLGMQNLLIRDNLQGIIGQYLLLSGGVINLRDYAGCDVSVALGPTFPAAELDNSDQLSLF